MTAVSAIVFFLGLLFGFQRPSRLLLPRLVCYAVSTSSLHPVQPGGCILYFEAAFLSSGRCRSVSPFRLVWSQHRAGALCFFLSRGAEPTSFPRLVSTRFVDPLFPLDPLCRLRDFAASRGSGFYHHRVGSQLRSPTSYFDFHCFVRGRRRQCDFAFPSEGARLLSPPRWESTTFADSLLPAPSTSSPLRLPPWGGARLLPLPR